MGSPVQPEADGSRKTNGQVAASVARWSLLVAALAFIAVGLVGGEQLAVYWKAVVVCLECIGIG